MTIKRKETTWAKTSTFSWDQQNQHLYHLKSDYSNSIAQYLLEWQRRFFYFFKVLKKGWEIDISPHYGINQQKAIYIWFGSLVLCAFWYIRFKPILLLAGFCFVYIPLGLHYEWDGLRSWANVRSSQDSITQETGSDSILLGWATV